jgi:hypothetical protein
MAKKKGKKDLSPVSPGQRGETHVSGSPPGLSKRGWKALFSGIGILVLGFLILSLADPRGQNWAANLSPYLILGGYAVMAVGLLIKDPAAPPSALS